MKKSTTPFTAQLVTFDTSLPFKEVIARLDVAINKADSLHFLAQFRAATTRAEIEELVNSITGGNDFLYFLEMNHTKWTNIYQGVVHPTVVVYTIGNPILAQTIMQHDICAGYNIPPRLMIVEKADRSGATVVYHLPSSVAPPTDNANLKAALETLDDKLDKLITHITAD